MGNEVIDRGESIYEKIISLDLSKFTFMDIIYIAGVITLFIFAIKVVGKFLKFILVILAILLLLYWLSTLGIFST